MLDKVSLISYDYKRFSTFTAKFSFLKQGKTMQHTLTSEETSIPFLSFRQQLLKALPKLLYMLVMSEGSLYVGYWLGGNNPKPVLGTLTLITTVAIGIYYAAKRDTDQPERTLKGRLTTVLVLLPFVWLGSILT